MAYAPHTNTQDMTQPRLLGSFETHKGTHFEYAVRPEADKVFNAPWMPHIVYVNDVAGHGCGYRAARVLGTVVYVVIDEDDNGPVVEKWTLKRHRKWA
jgi:hypothetical protein